MPPKVRFVKCPKCQNVLPESADVPVYRCGGCNTILQAKYRKTDAQNARRDLQEATDAPKDESVRGLEENKELNNFHREIVIPSSVENSVDLGEVKEQDVSMNRNRHQDNGIHNESVSSDGEGHEVSNGFSSLHGHVGNADRNEQTSGELSTSSDDRLEVPDGMRSFPQHVENPDGDKQTNGATSPITRAELREETNNSDFNEEQEKPQMSVPHRRMMSEETFASTEYVDPCSEFSEMSPMTIHGHRHAYGGSISSLDAPAEHFHNWDRSRGKQHLGRDEENFGLSKERLHKDKFVSSERPETSRGGFRGRHGTTNERSRELPPRVPVYKRAPRYVYEDEGLSDQAGNNLFPHSSGDYVSDLREDFAEEEEKMRLLQIVYELEDQLKKSCNLDRIGRRKSQDAYYSHELPEEEALMDLNFRRRNPWGRNFRSSRIPFSAETARTAHPLGYSPWGEFPRPRQRSEPLPPPPFHYKGARSTRTRDFYGPSISWPSSPQQYMGSEFSTGSGDPSYELQKLRKYYREREDHILKKHMRPVSGAAPFMTCYYCSEILLLPEDVFVFRKRCHRVRCGSCSRVLKFSLQNGIGIVPYEPDSHVPPPSEAGEYDNSMDAMNAGEINEGEFSPNGPRDTRNSPLHELMGYSTVSQVFKGYPRSSRRATSSSTRNSP